MRRTSITLAALVIIFALPVVPLPAWADENVDTLAKGVKSYPTKFKLISFGTRAVGPLMGQLESDDKWLVFESKSALRWIVHHARRDRKDVDNLAHHLAEYVSSDVIHPQVQRVFAAELLGDLAAPQGVSALMNAANSGDANIRTAAIDALGRIPGEDVTTKLVGHAVRVTGEHRDALLQVLGRRRDPAGLPPLLEHAESGNPVAVLALGDGGFAEGAPLLLKLYEKKTAGALRALLAVAHKQGDTDLLARAYAHAADDAQRLRLIQGISDAAPDAKRHPAQLLDLLQGAAKSDGLRVAAHHALLDVAPSNMASFAALAIVYRTILAESKDEAVTLRALTALGRTGVADATDLLASFLDAKKPAVRTTAIAALAKLASTQATDALIGALGNSVDRFEQSLLIRTLKERGDPRAMEALTTFLLAHQNEVRKEAGVALIALADQGGVQEARRVHHQLLDAGVQLPALRGLARTGDASSIEKIVPFLGAKSADLTRRALEALVAIGDRLADNDVENAVKAYRAALEGGAMVENKLRLLGESIEITARGGRVSAWWVAGPFSAPDQGSWSNGEFPETGVDLKAATKVGGREIRWKPVQVGGEDAIVDLDSLMSPNDNVAAYAFAEIHVRKDRKAVFKTGSDDGLRVWVNGELVHSVLEPRGLTVDEDSFEADLTAGHNTILVKVCEGGGGWGFCLRIEDERQRPLKFKIR